MSERRRWETWIWSNIMGLLPLGLWVLVHAALTAHLALTPAATRELLYFSLATTGTTLVELGDARHRSAFLFRFCLLAIIALAALYGVLLTSEIVHAAHVATGLYHISIGITAAMLLISLGVTVRSKWEVTYVVG